MPFWTFFGLRQGKATTPWPDGDAARARTGVLGMPRFEPERCASGMRGMRGGLPDRGDHG